MEIQLVAVRYPGDFAASGGIRSTPTAAARTEFQAPEELRPIAVGGVKRLSIVASFAPRKCTYPLSVTVGRDGHQSDALVLYKMPSGGPLFSRRHVSLEMSMRSDTILTMTCRDCGSMNGTFVHGKKISSGGTSSPIDIPIASLEASKEPLVVLDFGAGARVPVGQSLPDPVITVHVFAKLLMPSRDIPFSVFGRVVQRYDSPKIVLPAHLPAEEVAACLPSSRSAVPPPSVKSDHVLKQRTEDVLSGILRDHGFTSIAGPSVVDGPPMPLPVETGAGPFVHLVDESLRPQEGQQETLDDNPPEELQVVSSFVERANAADRHASYEFALEERSQSAPVIILAKAKPPNIFAVSEALPELALSPQIEGETTDENFSLQRRVKPADKIAAGKEALGAKKKLRGKGPTASQTVSAFIAELQAEREQKAAEKGKELAKTLISGLGFAARSDVTPSDSEEDMLLGDLLQHHVRDGMHVDLPQSCIEIASYRPPAPNSIVLASHVSSGDASGKGNVSMETDEGTNVFVLPPESYVARNFSQAQEGFSSQDAVFVAGAESQCVRPTIGEALFGDDGCQGTNSFDDSQRVPVGNADEVVPTRHFASLPSQKSIVLVPSQMFASQFEITSSRAQTRQFRELRPAPARHVRFDDAPPPRDTAEAGEKKPPRKQSGKRGRLDAAIDAIATGTLNEEGGAKGLVLDVKFRDTQGDDTRLGASDNARARLLNPSSHLPGAIVPEQLWSILKPHQRSALQFMWNIFARGDDEPLDLDHAVRRKQARTEQQRRSFLFGSQDERAAVVPEKPPSRGCVLAHAMGLGKTLSVIALLFMLWRYVAEHPAAVPMGLQGGLKCVLCVPKSVVFHWVRELNRWASAANEGQVVVFFLSGESRSDKSLLVSEWAGQATNGRCILLLTHSMLGHIMCGPPEGQRGKKRRKAAQEDDWNDDVDADDVEEAEAFGRSAATRSMYNKCREMIIASCNLVVVDEAHKIQRMGSKLAQALSQVSNAALRLALTGTPVTGNNFRGELRALLQCVMPSLWTEADLSDKAIGQYAKGILHGRSIDVLLPELPRLIEHEVRVKLSPVQATMFRDLVYLEEEKGVIPPRRLLETVFRTTLISNHCDLVADWARSKITDGSSLPPKIVQWALPSLTLPSALGEDPEASLEHSWKMSVLLSILHSSLHCGEKIVVFSHSLKTLALIGHMLQVGGLVDGEDFGVLTGTLPATARDDVTNAFNDPDSALAVLLLSFTSCSVGTSFTAASRVVLFDAAWKGLADAQAIFRVFRCGQMNDVVYVNKLICDNVIESKVVQLAAAAEMTDARAAVASTVSAHELLAHIGVVQGARKASQRPAENHLEADNALATALEMCEHMIASCATFSSFS